MYLPTRPVKTTLLLDVTKILKTKFKFTIFYVFLTGYYIVKIMFMVGLIFKSNENTQGDQKFRK